MLVCRRCGAVSNSDENPTNKCPRCRFDNHPERDLSDDEIAEEKSMFQRIMEWIGITRKPNNSENENNE